MNTVGPGIWWENWKTWKMRHKYCLTRNLTLTIQKRGKWDMHTGGPGLWWENWKTWAMRHKKCMTSHMARNIQKHGIWEITLKDLEYGRKNENHGKWEKHTVGCGIWQETLKTWKMRNAHSRILSMARKLKMMKNEKHRL